LARTISRFPPPFRSPRLALALVSDTGSSGVAWSKARYEIAAARKVLKNASKKGFIMVHNVQQPGYGWNPVTAL
jgi:hypothetical protein